jgi:hypothetical protein
MTVLPNLEQQLIRAAERATRTQRRPRRWRVRAEARSVAGGLALAIVVATTVAIVAGALILLGGHRRPVATSPAPAGRQQLIDILAPLQRAQTKADLGLKPLPHLLFEGAPDRPLIRFATTTPWGEKLYLVPMRPPTAKALHSIGLHLPAKLLAQLIGRDERLGVFSPGGGGGGADAASIEAGHAIQIDGAGHSFAGGSTETRFILVVPDGVAQVEFVLPRQPRPGQPGVPVYRHSSTVTVTVHDNIAAVQVDREFDGAEPLMVWYAADGQVIKRIGNFATVNRVTAPPKPGPETALSRAAQRDPSTPNPVWVTPAVGGPHTNFKIHFRVLLNDADYRYRLSGPACRTDGTLADGGGGGGPRDLRGLLWSDVIEAVHGAWCPGTYRISATVMDLGRYGMLKHPAKPFGSGTFTVRG